MRKAFWVAVLTIAGAVPVTAQPWLEAYNGRDYSTAAAILKPMVLDRQGDPAQPYADARAVQALGTLYAAGNGVERDPVMACALFNLGSGAARYQHGSGHAVTKAAERLVEEHCVPLTPAERQEVADLAGCIRTGPVPQVLPISPGHRVEVSRTQLRAKSSRRLQWTLLEVSGTSVAFRTRATLAQTDAEWPADLLQPQLRSRVILRMLKNGDVSWTASSSTPASGVVPRSKPTPRIAG
ncbi:MAG: hypothetical protein LC804_26650 [Acidobacteria bacterium]|nr:hypothetical protein [Acidobacteriota bacterium]